MGTEDSDIYPHGVQLRDWSDHDTLRANIYDGMKSAVSRQFPQSFGGVRLELHDVDYDSQEPFTIDEQKEALMKGDYLHRKLRGTLRLFDEKTGDLLDEKSQTLMKVPHLTDRGTFIHAGSEYATIHQARLLPGAYTRRKDSGELETHFNAKRGSGHSFRVRLEPETGLFKMDIGQASLRLHSLMKDLGIPDAELEKRWGPDVLKANQDGYDRRVFDKAHQRLVRKPDLSASHTQKQDAIRAALADTYLNLGTVQKTMPDLLTHRKMASAFQAGGATGSYESSGGNAQSSEPDTAFQGSVDLAPPPGSEADQAGEGISKEDLVAIALYLNKQFDAGIDVNESLGELADDIREVIHSDMPGINPAVSTSLAGQFGKQAAAVRTNEELDRAAHRAATSESNQQKLPTKPQRHSGNYRKGHVRLHGLDIAIENPKGSWRRGVNRQGEKWAIKMKSHYGYIKKTEGADGDHLDCFIGTDLDSDHVFVVNQLDTKTGRFDEHKLMVCFPNIEAAKAGYLENYQPGWRGMGSVRTFEVNEFRKLLPTMDLTRAL